MIFWITLEYPDGRHCNCTSKLDRWWETSKLLKISDRLMRLKLEGNGEWGMGNGRPRCPRLCLARVRYIIVYVFQKQASSVGQG